ncbi:MAG: hypothetical protein E7304_02030 [Butyrivibrio sp.]|jgi:hypothetical protein|uniref:DUF6115 domain-containing protein n=1 Tax=Butyrivibrio sp. TaxID=28121 RepID=UPI001EC5361D|nr:DUF6115 domain-containing protein [Butyrivibrio sp.]MBE5840166.1 hypothetical protein [Butyrivibrio sp.]
MISITEIVLIVAGFVAIILGYLLPAGKEIDEEDKLLMEREIRELVRREVEDQKETIENMVDDTVDNSLDRTERAMERISNEKLSAIGEYSDTVINDIHKNHDEVMFMYDMLNDKHKNLTDVVSEVTRKADEAKRTVMDAEATANEAKQATDSFKSISEASFPESNVRAILLDEEEDKPSGIRIPYKEKYNVKPVSPVAKVEQDLVGPEPIGNVESGYVEEKNVKELKELDAIPAEVIKEEQVQSLHVIGNKVKEEPKETTSAKVVSINDVKPSNPDRNMKELTANDPISQNKQIIEMHKAGKSNMVIARELGLGIGEVKLVIDLSNKHRKVK